MSKTCTITKEVASGHWAWGKDCDQARLYTTARTLDLGDKATTQEALTECLESKNRPPMGVRSACAERLFEVDTDDATRMLWQVVERKTIHRQEVQSANVKARNVIAWLHSDEFKDAGFYLGAILYQTLVKGSQGDQGQVFEKYFTETGPDIDLIRGGMYAYLMSHPHPGLIPYVVRGLEMKSHAVGFPIAIGLSHRPWPYDQRLTHAILRRYGDPASPDYRMHFLRALGRMKAPEAIPLLRREIGIPDFSTHVKDPRVFAAAVQVLCLDLEDEKAAPLMIKLLLGDGMPTGEKQERLVRLINISAPWARSAALTVIQETPDDAVRTAGISAFAKKYPNVPILGDGTR